MLAAAKSNSSAECPDLLVSDGGRLSGVERFHVRFVQRTLEAGWADGAIRWCQRRIGAAWIHWVMKRALHVRGAERLPTFEPGQSYVLVANHRSFFDLYAITTELVRLGLRHRILFPVRSQFFYDSPLGFAVNGLMSFFAMYPPIFRERQKLSLNLVSLDELATRLHRGGVVVGVHPEGTRNQGADPYTLLPAQRGVGRLIQHARVPVIPVFANGLSNDFLAQIRNGFVREPRPIVVVFGAPLDFAAELAAPSSPRVHRQIAERTLEAVARLGQEERRFRAELEQGLGPAGLSAS